MVNTLKCYNAILFNDGKWWAFGQSKFYMHTKWIICIICFRVFCNVFIAALLFCVSYIVSIRLLLQICDLEAQLKKRETTWRFGRQTVSLTHRSIYADIVIFIFEYQTCNYLLFVLSTVCLPINRYLEHTRSIRG